MKPPWLYRLTSIVFTETGESLNFIRWQMPLREVFVWEHVHYDNHGWLCSKANQKQKEAQSAEYIMTRLSGKA